MKKEKKESKISKLYKPQISVQLYCSPIETKKYRAIYYENGKKKKHVDFGASKYNDYTIYYAEEGKEEADKHKEAYIARHKPREEQYWHTDPFSKAALSRWILWEESTIDVAFNNYKNKFGFQ